MEAKLDDKGLIPAIAQDANTGQVLMLGYMNPGSLKRTMEGRQAWFYSRSREELWHKGEVSGNFLDVEEAYLDCDGDTVLLKVKPHGPTCHTGNVSCFFTPMEEAPEEFQRSNPGSGVLEELYALIQDRKLELPEGSYTTSLFKGGIGRIAQKVIEEAGEAAIAAVESKPEELAPEVADLLYHTLVLLAASGVPPSQVWEQLDSRRK